MENEDTLERKRIEIIRFIDEQFQELKKKIGV